MMLAIGKNTSSKRLLLEKPRRNEARGGIARSPSPADFSSFIYSARAVNRRKSSIRKLLCRWFAPRRPSGGGEFRGRFIVERSFLRIIANVPNDRGRGGWVRAHEARHLAIGHKTATQ